VEAPLAPGARNVFLFGVAYGIASLACTLPIFLLVVGSSLVTRGLLASLGQFIGYGLGMGTLLTAVTLSVALFKGALVSWLRKLLPAVHQVSAALMAIAGAFIVAYWLYYGPWRF
jgi:cytochrome c-type biogenesis protein